MNPKNGRYIVQRPLLVIAVLVAAIVAIVLAIRDTDELKVRPASGTAVAMSAAADRPVDAAPSR